MVGLGRMMPGKPEIRSKRDEQRLKSKVFYSLLCPSSLSNTQILVFPFSSYENFWQVNIMIDL